ncbi:MAG: hypothetical protein V1763_02795 [Parcubacteria group bacterium]
MMKLIASLFERFGYRIDRLDVREIVCRYKTAENKLDRFLLQKRYKADERQFGCRFYDFKVPSTPGLREALILQLDGNWIEYLYRTSIDEYISLKPFFDEHIIGKMNGGLNIIDLGGGIGRSSVFLLNTNGLANEAQITVVDSNKDIATFSGSATAGYAMLNDFQTGYHEGIVDIKKSAYTNFQVASDFLRSNNVKRFDIVELGNFATLALRFDLLYSFHSVGYHYSIKNAVVELKLAEKANPGAFMIFGVRREHLKSDRTDKYAIPFNIDGGFRLVDYVGGKCWQDYLIFQKI